MQFLEAAPMGIVQWTKPFSESIHHVIHIPLRWFHFRYLTIGIASHSLNVLFFCFFFVNKKNTELVRGRRKTKSAEQIVIPHTKYNRFRPIEKKMKGNRNEGIKKIEITVLFLPLT